MTEKRNKKRVGLFRRTTNIPKIDKTIVICPIPKLVKYQKGKGFISNRPTPYFNETYFNSESVWSKWMIVGFSNFKLEDSFIKDLYVYNANVNIDFGGYSVHRTIIPEDVLFPNSQSNL